MAFTRAWQEALPDDENFGYELDDFQRQTRVDLRERLGVQHNTYADETGETDVGEHKPGECNVAYVGEKADFPVPATSNAGPLAVATDEGNQLYYWSGSAWTKVQEPVLITGAQTIAGAKTFADIKASDDIDIGSFNLKAQTLESDVVTGTAPLAVVSTTKVDNLNVANADTVDGFHAEAYAGGESHTLPGGMVIKQGTKAGANPGTVTFAAAFPTACTRVIVSFSDSVYEGDYAPKVLSKAASNFTFGSDVGASVEWIAIGY